MTPHSCGESDASCVCLLNQDIL